MNKIIGSSKWLEAHLDRSANLTTLPGNVVLADVTGTGEFHLIFTDLKLFENDTLMKSRLKVYKGTLLISDQPLANLPNSIISFYAENNHLSGHKIPVIGVACDAELFLYKNLKPFHKFRVPFCRLMPEEVQIWSKIIETKQFQIDELVNSLKAIPYSSLTARSQEILNLNSTAKIEEFVNKYMHSMPNKENIITCMTIIPRNSKDPGSISYPVLATEFGNIFILDPSNFSIIHQANTCNLKTTPFSIKATGFFDVEFRLVIATRERHICLLQKGWLEGKSLTQLTSNIVDFVLISGDNFIVVATSDKFLHCYSKRGQKLWSTETFTQITCLCLVPLSHLNINLVAVGLKNGSIQLFQGRFPVDFISTSDTPSVIAYGQLGQEENVMVIITIGGCLNLKILKRTADFSTIPPESSPLIQSKPLPLPKRSKLFIEQSIRERQNALEIHQSFQQDLIRLRLSAAKALVQNLNDQSGMMANEKEQIKLSAQVLGLGPKFTVILTIENINPQKALAGISITYHVNPINYKLSTYIRKIPLIPPSMSYKTETKAEEIFQDNDDDDDAAKNNDNHLLNNNNNNKIIRVFVTRHQLSVPVLAATINMPPTELII